MCTSCLLKLLTFQVLLDKIAVTLEETVIPV